MILVTLLALNVLGECPSICTQDYSPVCAGVAGKTPQTFSNACALEVHNCQQGTCKYRNIIHKYFESF